MKISEPSKDKKVLCLVAGVPYSGKTTFSHYLRRIREYPFLEGDKSDRMYSDYLLGSPKDRAAFDELQRRYRRGELTFYESQVYTALFFGKNHAQKTAQRLHNGHDIIAERTFLIPSLRTSFIQMVRERIDVSAEGYWVTTDLDTVLQRHRRYQAEQELVGHRRGSRENPRGNLTEDALKTAHMLASIPTLEEGFDKIFLVKGISPKEFDITEK